MNWQQSLQLSKVHQEQLRRDAQNHSLAKLIRKKAQ